MKFHEANIGMHTADAEDISIQYNEGDLLLRYVDWQEQPKAFTFVEALAFRWQEFDDEARGQDIRDDMAYRVTDSPWLTRQCELQAEPAEQFTHYKLCFNACGVLDVICKSVEPVN